ncbi:hypothetical protein [Microcoleus sp. B4-C2]
MPVPQKFNVLVERASCPFLISDAPYLLINTLGLKLFIPRKSPSHPP